MKTLLQYQLRTKNGSCGIKCYSIRPPVHVAGLWADFRLSGVDAGVVNDRRDVLVAIPHLEKERPAFFRVSSRKGEGF